MGDFYFSPITVSERLIDAVDDQLLLLPQSSRLLITPLGQDDEYCTEHCRSEPARDSGGSVNGDADWAGLIASRLTPTGFCVEQGKWCLEIYWAPNIAVQ